MMAIEVFHNKEISGEGKGGEGNGIGYAIRRKRANRGSINIRK